MKAPTENTIIEIIIAKGNSSLFNGGLPRNGKLYNNPTEKIVSMMTMIAYFSILYFFI